MAGRSRIRPPRRWIRTRAPQCAFRDSAGEENLGRAHSPRVALWSDGAAPPQVVWLRPRRRYRSSALVRPAKRTDVYRRARAQRRRPASAAELSLLATEFRLRRAFVLEDVAIRRVDTR